MSKLLPRTILFSFLLIQSVFANDSEPYLLELTNVESAVYTNDCEILITMEIVPSEEDLNTREPEYEDLARVQPINYDRIIRIRKGRYEQVEKEFDYRNISKDEADYSSVLVGEIVNMLVTDDGSLLAVQQDNICQIIDLETGATKFKFNLSKENTYYPPHIKSFGKDEDYLLVDYGSTCFAYDYTRGIFEEVYKDRELGLWDYDHEKQHYYLYSVTTERLHHNLTEKRLYRYDLTNDKLEQIGYFQNFHWIMEADEDFYFSHDARLSLYYLSHSDILDDIDHERLMNDGTDFHPQIISVYEKYIISHDLEHYMIRVHKR
jgi:hypothetical protein